MCLAMAQANTWQRLLAGCFNLKELRYELQLVIQKLRYRPHILESFFSLAGLET